MVIGCVQIFVKGSAYKSPGGGIFTGFFSSGDN
jgi:hypothetical protein